MKALAWAFGLVALAVAWSARSADVAWTVLE